MATPVTKRALCVEDDNTGPDSRTYFQIRTPTGMRKSIELPLDIEKQPLLRQIAKELGLKVNELEAWICRSLQ